MSFWSGLGKVLGTVGKGLTSAAGLDLISTGAGLVGSLVGSKQQANSVKEANAANLEIARQNNETSMQIARQNNEIQQQMQRENNEFNRQQAIDMFNMENEYNSPLAQVQRLQQAGLNPAVMMEGAGGTAVGNSSAAAPSAAASGISPSMPSLTTPHMEAVPPMALGFIEALKSVSEIKQITAQTKKTGAETSRIEKLVDQELLSLIADEKDKQARASYQNLMTNFEKLYGHDKRAADIAKTLSDYLLNVRKGNTEAAQAALLKAEKELTDTKNKMQIEQAPVILENLRKTGELIDEQKATEKSKQSANYASAEESRAGKGYKEALTRLTDLQADEREMLNEVIPDEIALDLSIKTLEAVGRILTEGRAKTVPELVDMIIQGGVRQDAAKEIGKRLESYRKRLETKRDQSKNEK